MNSLENKKAQLQIKRLELAVDEGEIRVLDLENEIEKIKEKNALTITALEEKRQELEDQE